MCNSTDAIASKYFLSSLLRSVLARPGSLHWEYLLKYPGYEKFKLLNTCLSQIKMYKFFTTAQ